MLILGNVTWSWWQGVVAGLPLVGACGGEGGTPAPGWLLMLPPPPQRCRRRGGNGGALGAAGGLRGGAAQEGGRGA